MKVSVYIPVHNYGQYIEEAIQSVIKQKFSDWELIIINDGSTDNTASVLKKHKDNPKVRIIEQENKGLAVSNNIALRISNGKYLIRLDADDYFDENALLVLSNILDTNPDVGLVYSDYYLIDEHGEIMEIIRRKKIGEEAQLLDLSVHGAGTMIRKECLLAIGGYQEEFVCQDGYDLWIRFLESFKPYNVNIPLFYYRQHHMSLSKDQGRLLKTRGAIKSNFVTRQKDRKIPRILAVIPVVKRSKGVSDGPFNELNGKPLIWYTLNEASKSKLIDKIVVNTNDDSVLDYCGNFNGIIPVKRPERLTFSYSKIGATLLHTLEMLEKEQNYAPEAVMVLNINTPLRKSFHIDKSIHTMVIFNVDSVIAVTEEIDHLYHHEKYGLNPINKQKGISLERKAVYKSSGAICLTRTSAITKEDILGKTIGHIVMLPEESVRIRNNFEFWIASKIISEWRENG